MYAIPLLILLAVALIATAWTPIFALIIAVPLFVAFLVFGAKVRVTRDRGRLLDSPLAPVAAVTVHPSAILRVRERDEREDALAGLAEDLKLVAGAAAR